MRNTTYKEVKDKCVEGRFFPYDDWRDKMFVPPSIFLVWVFVKLKWNGNSVSFLSGFVAILGGVLLSTHNKTLILIGSFGYPLFYLLDYVDGGVSRFNKSTGITGQYIDWLMHSVTSLAIFSGIFYGAININTTWLMPFGILMLIGCSLNLDRHSFGWFSICMHYQQQVAKKNILKTIQINETNNVSKPSLFFKTVRLFGNFFFHENFAIFSIPLLSLINIFINDNKMDFRIIYILVGGLIHFPIVIIEIWKLSNSNKIEKAYNDIFFDNKIPKLPEDHFF